MDMWDGSRRLIPDWKTSGMEEDCCCCGGVAGLHRQNTIQVLRQKQIRLQRMARFLAAGLLVLISLSVAVLITVVRGGRSHQSPDRQVNLSIPAQSVVLQLTGAVVANG